MANDLPNVVMENFELGAEVDRIKRDMREMRKEIQVVEAAVDSANASIAALSEEVYMLNEVIDNIFEAISWPDTDDYTYWQLTRGTIPRSIFSIRLGRDMSKESFGWRMVTKGLVRIYAGSLRVGGKGIYTASQTDVALTGSTEYVYVKWLRATPNTVTITNSANEPASDGTTVKIPLYKFLRGTDNSGRYWLDHDYRTDILFDAVTR